MSAATPLPSADRIENYLRQTGAAVMTPAQRRRDDKKHARARRLVAGRILTPRQSRWAEIRRVRAARKAAGR